MQHVLDIRRRVPVQTSGEQPILRRRSTIASSEHTSPRRQDAIASALRQDGAPLPDRVRATFERSMGHDFGRIRVHVGSLAAQAARSVEADAFTVGRHVVFGAGRFAPQTPSGDRLLAHELAHTVQQGQAEAPDDAATLRISTPGEAAERAADQASAGLAPAAQLGRTGPAIQRQPEQPPNLGPPVSEVPRPPICSLIFEGGGVYWKCENIPKIGSTPKIPLDPRKIPDEIDKILKKSPSGDGPPRPPPSPLPDGRQQGPGPFFPIEDPNRLVEQMCRLYPFVCQPAPAPQPDPGSPMPQLGLLWTDTVLFEQDHPTPGESDPGRVLTAEGRKTLQSVREWLDLSSDLQIRLIGGASSEGTHDYNQALAARRVEFIVSALARYPGRIADPLVGDGAEAGCRSLGKGLWNCGDSQATSGEIRPEDRFVKVTFLRNSLPALPPLQFRLPGARPGLF